MEYWQKLKDPRWQKLRLEAMQNSEFSCHMCADDKSTLNVHHKEYFKGYEPWEYDIKQLSVLCESCHKDLHDNVDLFKWVGSYAHLDGPGNREELAFLICGYLNYPLNLVLDMMGQELYLGIQNAYDSGVLAQNYQQKKLNERIKK